MRKIVGIGETVLDVIFRNDAPTAAVPGGSTFNAMISLGRTVRPRFPETEVVMVTETGDDHIGDIVTGFMTANGVGTRAVTRNEGTQTHVSMAFLDDNDDAQYEFYKDHAHARLDAGKVGAIDFDKDDIVLFGSFFAINPVIRDYTRGLLTAAREAGAIIYYDINFRPSHLKDLPDTIDNIIENCRLSDFVRGSTEDFAHIGVDRIRPLCHNLIVTGGAAPTEVFSGEEKMTFRVKEIETVSTIGAGDNFNAGFLFSLLEQGVVQSDCKTLGSATWTKAIETATAFSSAVCQSIFNYVPEDFKIK